MSSPERPDHRERRERAEDLEYEAEQTGDSDTWIVASDAWTEAGDVERAWYARLRSCERYGNSVGRLITRARAEEIALALENDHRVTNEDRGALELFRFMALQPERVFAYYNPNTATTTSERVFAYYNRNTDEHVGDDIRTFIGDYLGTVVHRGRVTHPFGNRNARIQYVHVRAINGYIYRGTCALDSGNYCRLRRANAWLR